MEPLSQLGALFASMIEKVKDGETEQGYTQLSLTLTGHLRHGGTETIDVPVLVPWNNEQYLGFGVLTDEERLPGEGYEGTGPGPHLPVLIVYGWQAVPNPETGVAYTVTVDRIVTYRGYRGGLVVVQDKEGAESPLPHLVRHSPTGFAWGYGGSGPADLARSMLAHATGEEPPEAEYMDFKFEVVTQMPEDGWGLPQHAVQTWHQQWVEGHQ